MQIKLFEKKYKKTKDHDGTIEIQLDPFDVTFLFNEINGKAFKIETTGKEVTKTLNIKAIKKEVPNCVNIKNNNIYINN